VAAKRDNSNVYGATKAAVNVITGTLRDELEDEPIRVVSVMPGVVGTNFGRTFRPETVNGLLAAVGMPATYKSGDIFGDDTVAELNRRAASIFASPDDIARAVLFAVTQPHDLNVLELVVRPRKQIPIAG
jgi:NADP-dependent 3-hydroxy acid dehydrogenase YdfG